MNNSRGEKECLKIPGHVQPKLVTRRTEMIMYLAKTPKKTHAATTLLVFRIHILDRIKFTSPGPSLTLPPQILLIAHCGPLVAPLNGARSLRWAIAVGKQPVKYGRLQTHYERSRAFLETCTQFSIQSWNPFTVLVAFLCVFPFSPPMSAAT